MATIRKSAKPDDELASGDWTFARDIEGQQNEKVILDWSFEVPGGGRFTDQAHATLHQQMTFYLRSALDNGVLSVGSLPATMMSIREIAVYMIRRKIDSLISLTSLHSWDFIDHLENQYLEGSFDEGRPRDWSYATAYKLLRPLAQIYELKAKYKEAGIDCLPEPPFDGKSANRVVEIDLGLKKGGGLAPIPDDVAVPLLSRAWEWIRYGLDDVIKIQNHFLQRRSQMPERGPARVKAFEQLSEELRDYEMAIVPGTGLPWHAPLHPRTRIDEEGTVVEVSTVQSVRRLVMNTIAAATICIQGCVGLRSHELIGLKISHVNDPLDGIVTIHPSSDGLMDIFMINGVSAKGKKTDHAWTAGLRPCGTDYEPIPIAALEALCRVLEPWRLLKGEGTKDLLLSFSEAKSLPSHAKHLGRFTAMRIAALQREFATELLVSRYGLSAQDAWHRTRSIRPLRWRKTFAHYIYRTKPGLLGALRDHYRHMSERITETGYIGSDAALLEDLQGERTLEAGQFFLEVMTGHAVAAGPAKKLIAEHASELASSINSMDGDTAIDKALALVRISGFEMWTGTYASCLINILPAESACNPHADLLTGWRQPDFGVRSPTLCASCRCCLILPEHREFWQRRMKENQAIVAEEKRRGGLRSGRSIAERRVVQSQSILRHLREATASESDD
ncbi:integrase [uncultured Stenotrophomonas sp.]|uniref:integrase n=1 Tax=uncultured Stenotrophomonas sp. TaxID=165438 RepID=UPI002584B9E6|nr:integrase [uncultured Stenotrophomonas sp.]